MSDIVLDPIRRQRYRFSRDGADLLAEVETAPGGDVPEHVHPAQTEWWEVVEGEVTFVIDGQARRALVGDRVRADAGVRHAFVNDSATPAVLASESHLPVSCKHFSPRQRVSRPLASSTHAESHLRQPAR